MMISSRKSQNNGDMSRSGGEEKSNEEPNRSIPFEWDRRTDVNEIVEVALQDRRYLAGCFSIEFSHRHIWSPPVPARIYLYRLGILLPVTTTMALTVKRPKRCPPIIQSGDGGVYKKTP